jgi:hemolysin activation/secretion protein
MIRTVRVVLSVLFLFFTVHGFAAALPQDPVPRFDIRGYTVEGNTLIAAERLEAILSPFTGESRHFGTVQEAIEALDRAYRDRGFSMVKVTLPEQEMKNGLVRILVIENRIGTVQVEGNHFFDLQNIRNSLPGLREGETPNVNSISRSLHLANENPAKKIHLSLQKSIRADEINAKVTVRDERPWRIGITADNTGNKETGNSRLGFLFQHANIAGRDHLLTLQYITSPEKVDKVGIYSMGYRIPFYSLGSSVDFIGAYSSVNSGTITAPAFSLDVSGKGTALGIHYNQNLTRIGNYEHKLLLALDYRAYENDVNFLGVQLGHDVTVHPISLTYAGKWTFDTVRTGFYLTGLQNLPGSWGSHDEAADFENARAGAPRGYNLLRYGANLSYVFGGDWQARALINGQYTNDALVPGEQFGLGGSGSVRGFREREIANDRGYAASVELHTPDLAQGFGFSAFETRFLVFYDRGSVSRNHALPGDIVRTEIASVGPGIRITDGKRFSLSADWGIVVEPPDGSITGGSSIWHLSASILF